MSETTGIDMYALARGLRKGDRAIGVNQIARIGGVMIKAFLFGTGIGNALIALFERATGLTIIDLEWLDLILVHRLNEEGIRERV